MKTFIWLFSSLLLVSCGETPSENEDVKTEEQAQQEGENIAQKLKVDAYQKKIQEKENAQIIDVRTPEELTRGYVEGAVNYNFYNSDFESKIDGLDKDKPVFVYCAAGGRSGEAFEMLKSKGFNEVYDMAGGMNAWYASGLPTKK